MLLCDAAWLEKRITANQYANIPVEGEQHWLVKILVISFSHVKRIAAAQVVFISLEKLCSIYLHTKEYVKPRKTRKVCMSVSVVSCVLLEHSTVSG